MENYTFVGQVTAVDEENATLSFSISGGADQSFFELNSTTGHLSFITAPDFETALIMEPIMFIRLLFRRRTV